MNDSVLLRLDNDSHAALAAAREKFHQSPSNENVFMLLSAIQAAALVRTAAELFELRQLLEGMEVVTLEPHTHKPNGKKGGKDGL